MTLLLRAFVASVATMGWSIPAHAASSGIPANDALSASVNWNLINTAASASNDWVASAAPGSAGSMVAGFDADSAIYFMMQRFNESEKWYGEEILQAERSDILSPNESNLGDQEVFLTPYFGLDTRGGTLDAFVPAANEPIYSAETIARPGLSEVVGLVDEVSTAADLPYADAFTNVVLNRPIHITALEASYNNAGSIVDLVDEVSTAADFPYADTFTNVVLNRPIHITALEAGYNNAGSIVGHVDEVSTAADLPYADTFTNVVLNRPIHITALEAGYNNAGMNVRYKLQ